MKKEQAEKKIARTTPEKSFSAAIEQMAQLLRTQVKLKDRKTKVLLPSAFSASFNNTLEQIARLLQSQIRTLKAPKKRTWKRK